MNLLHDGGIDDKDSLVRYIWKGLALRLALATPLREVGDTVESFGRRVRNNETVARRVHELERRKPVQSQPVQYRSPQYYDQNNTDSARRDRNEKSL